MKRHLLYLLTWLGGRKWRRYRRGKRLEQLIVRKLNGNVDVVDAAITELLASRKKPIVYRHGHWENNQVYCLHIPVLIMKK